MTTNGEHREMWGGEMKTTSQIYAQGMEDEARRAKSNNRSTVEDFVTQVQRMILSPAHVAPDHERSTPGTWPSFYRAVEHIVTDIDPATAATPHGVFSVNPTTATPLATVWTDESLRANRYATLVEQEAGSGIPQIPRMTTIPTAGPQGGEKTDVYSKAYSIEIDPDSTMIDSTLYLNVSELVQEVGLIGFCIAVMGSTVANEASRQVLAAMTTNATDGGADVGTAFAAFDGGRYVPNVVIVPPSKLIGIDATALTAADIPVVVDPNATTTLVADRRATVGWFRSNRMMQAEPSRYGIGVASVVYGRVGVDPAGVVAVTGP